MPFRFFFLSLYPNTVADSYKQIALRMRQRVLKMIHKAQTSHIGSNFSCIDIIAVLSKVARRGEHGHDRVIFSKGWAAAGAYCFLVEQRVIPEADLDLYCQDGSPYIGLLEPTVNGVECAGGSMGYGLPFGVGFALANKMRHSDSKTFVLMSDGEQAIGTTWESALLAAHHKLDNLTVIVDYNGLQAMGPVQDVLDIRDLATKWRSFGWTVEFCDGHDHEALEHALTRSRYGKKPKIIIAKTVKGKGVSWMEGNNLYHYWHIDDEHYEKAMAELV